MNTQKLIAMTAAVLFTAMSLYAVSPSVTVAPLSQINGIKVIDLAPVMVQPSAADLRTDALQIQASTRSLQSRARASLLGAQLAMPYYSFGNTFGRVNKE